MISDYLKYRQKHIAQGRLKQPKKRKKIPKVSRKREAENEAYRKLRVEFLKKNPRCQCGRNGCTRKSTDVHHTAGRGGKNFLDVGTWRALNRTCHRWVEENPNEAKSLNLAVFRLKMQKPEQ